MSRKNSKDPVFLTSERRYRDRKARTFLKASGSLVTNSVGPTRTRGPISNERPACNNQDV
jgi:hypothetical protein